mmetsp:Transcript_41562/g.120331  ORF Transcript_41562/g.120331 Transcript_41562/m.120331 type:complete len:380 (-) Transcript_41562:452-1591(-)
MARSHSVGRIKTAKDDVERVAHRQSIQATGGNLLKSEPGAHGCALWSVFARSAHSIPYNSIGCTVNTTVFCGTPRRLAGFPPLHVLRLVKYSAARPREALAAELSRVVHRSVVRGELPRIQELGDQPAGEAEGLHVIPPEARIGLVIRRRPLKLLLGELADIPRASLDVLRGHRLVLIPAHQPEVGCRVEEGGQSQELSNLRGRRLVHAHDAARLLEALVVEVEQLPDQQPASPGIACPHKRDIAAVNVDGLLGTTEEAWVVHPSLPFQLPRQHVEGAEHGLVDAKSQVARDEDLFSLLVQVEVERVQQERCGRSEGNLKRCAAHLHDAQPLTGGFFLEGNGLVVQEVLHSDVLVDPLQIASHGLGMEGRELVGVVPRL